jgi:hypothetical protein
VLAGLADDHAPVLLGNPTPDVPGGQGKTDRAGTTKCPEAGHCGRRLALRAMVTAVTVAVLVVVVVPLLLVTLVVPVIAAFVVVPGRLVLFG